MRAAKYGSRYTKQALEATTPLSPGLSPQDETTEPAGKPSFVQETMMRLLLHWKEEQSR